MVTETGDAAMEDRLAEQLDEEIETLQAQSMSAIPAASEANF